MKRTTGCTLVFAVAMGACPTAARAFDATTTHVGLTQRAVLASTLKGRLGALYAWSAGRPLGLFHQLTLTSPGNTSDARIAGLRARLELLDPAVGVRPEAGKLTALGWLLAGAVLEETPAARAQNHFLTPPEASATGTASPTGAVRGLDVESGAASMKVGFTQPGEFAGRGLPSTAWLLSADNDLGLPRFIDARARSLSAATPALREAAAAESLLVAGALLHVIEDAAEPAYVHNDLVVDLFERQAPFSRYVATRFGRLSLPEPSGPAVPLAHLADAIHNNDGTGLADRTAARFFSLGLLAAASGANGGGAISSAALPRLEAGPAAEGYVEGTTVRHAAHYTRDARGQGQGQGQGQANVRWDLDARCYAGASAVLLPEAATAALSALEHLFRGGLSIDATGIRNGDLALGAGKLHVLVEEEGEARRELAATEVKGADAGVMLGPLPPGAEGKHVVVVFRGVDAAGEPIVVGGEAGR